MTTHQILTWQINSTNQERQEVLRSIDGGVDTVIATLSATDTSYVDSDEFAMTTNVQYQVASIATINGEEVRVPSESVEYVLPPANVMRGETAGEQFNVQFTQPVELKIAGVIVEPIEGTNAYAITLDPAKPETFTVAPQNDTQPFTAIYGNSGIGKITEWYPGGYSEDIALGIDIVSVPTTLHPTITNLSSMFSGSIKFNDPNVTLWNTSAVTNLSRTFAGATLFNQDISTWDTSSVNYLWATFQNAVNFNQPIGLWNTSAVIDDGRYSGMNEMFNGAVNFDQDLTQWCVPNLTVEPYAISEGSALQQTNLPVWGTCPRGENAA